MITNPYLQLDELVSLIETLPNYRVFKKLVVPIKDYKNDSIFGRGKVEELTEIIKHDTNIDGVVIGLSSIDVAQYITLQKIWRKPLYDKYRIILQIFKHYAKTNESRLQIALAEIPYLKMKLRMNQQIVKMKEIDPTLDISSIFHENIYFNNDNRTSFHEKLEILNQREDKLKKSLEKIKQGRENRKMSNSSSLQNPYPIIAVIGYTNSGKTSLIKALAVNQTKLSPENRLFATLDVSLHQGILPYSEKVLYLDTIGFISDIPVSLISAFQVTLSDINRADILLHVRDASHPDTNFQNLTVMETLKSLGIKQELIDNMIEVHNKIDLLPKLTVHTKIENPKLKIFPTSITKSVGLSELLTGIHMLLLKRQNKSTIHLKIPIQLYSKIYSYLLKMNASIVKTEPTDDSQNYMLEIVIDQKTLSIFKINFDPRYIVV
ncbi:unnamed protein product [Gordionus sp. m RMFG-2023]|uniref:putative GTP-binding protein 6 n=1 Tax=Gordionus sp. m RMFG-2023 TaxID=3053472 RepID=UPI0030E45645